MPVPLFINTEIVLEVLFAVARSGLPSPLKSAVVSAYGVLPVA